MRKIVSKFRFSKYKSFVEGLLFATISMISIVLCISAITDKSATEFDIILPFIISIISLLIGFIVMTHESKYPGRV